jgi:hypothetical protein
MPDGTYAPQSPDLSSFFSGSSTTKPLPSATAAQTSSDAYAPRSPDLAALGTSTGYAPSSPRLSDFEGGYGHQRAHSNQLTSYGESLGLDYGAVQQQGASSYLPPIPDLPYTHTASLQSPAKNPYGYQVPSTHYPQPQPYQTQSIPQPQEVIYGTQSPQQSFSYPGIKQEDSYGSQFQQSTQPQSQTQQYSDFGSNSQFDDMSSQARKPAVKSEPDGGLGPSLGIEVKTKFPVARIKRIMQADEDVGKVAQVTPVAVCTFPIISLYSIHR